MHLFAGLPSKREGRYFTHAEFARADGALPGSSLSSLWTRERSAQTEAIVQGLIQPQASIASRYLYDERGSELFESITRLPEYYLSRVEQSILQRHADVIANSIGSDAVVIELGAGNCEKSRSLCLRLQAREFVGVDISANHLYDAVQCLQANMPWLRARAVVADVTEGVPLPDDLPASNRLAFYPGSSIGNFAPSEVVQILTHMRAMLGSSNDNAGVLIGIDLPKSETLLRAAYEDASGVTAAFNRNALEHVNRLIGSNFVPERWQHRAVFNADLARVEMHLVATTVQSVQWQGGGREFSVGEYIHTESSYKYPLDVFTSLLRHAGFLQHRGWVDEQGWFAVIHARP